MRASYQPWVLIAAALLAFVFGGDTAAATQPVPSDAPPVTPATATLKIGQRVIVSGPSPYNGMTMTTSTVFTSLGQRIAWHGDNWGNNRFNPIQGRIYTVTSLGAGRWGFMYVAGPTAGSYENYLSYSLGAVWNYAGPCMMTVQNQAFVGPISATTLPNGSSVQLTVAGGDASCSYVWSGTRDGAALPGGIFSASGTNAARITTATLPGPGSYVFTCTVNDQCTGHSFIDGSRGSQPPTSYVALLSTSPIVAQPVVGRIVITGGVSLPATGQRRFTATAYDQFDAPFVGPVAFAWRVSGGGTIDAATGDFTATTVGTFTATASANGVSGSATFTVTPNAAPTIATAASASPTTVTGTSSAVSVRGADDTGESRLVYTWSTVSGPAVTFTVPGGANGTNAARDAIALFPQAGAYRLRATVRDPGNLTAASDVVVTVSAAPTALKVTPTAVSVARSATATFAATATDQFGKPMTTAAPTWTVSGGGAIVAGVFTAGPVDGGPHTVTATVAGFAPATAKVYVGSAFNAPPAISAISAAASPVITAGTTLRVTATDDGGEPALTYRWAVQGTPPGAVQFGAANGANGAKALPVTFSASGTYAFIATATDARGSTATSAVLSVPVVSTATSADVSPRNAIVAPGAALGITLTVRDQFGWPIEPAPLGTTWTASGGGSFPFPGQFQAGATAGGPFAVTVTITNSPLVANGTVTIATGNAAPSIVAGPSTTSSTVHGSRTNVLSVQATDDRGEASLRYHWQLEGAPTTAVRFTAPNDTNAAKDMGVVFDGPGFFTFRVTVVDGGGLSTSATVDVPVGQGFSVAIDPPAAALLRPGTALVAPGSATRFTARLVDQFGNVATPSAALAWTCSGGGTIAADGTFTAGLAGGGPFTITATDGMAMGTIQVLVDSAPVLARPAAAKATTVSGRTIDLSVLGDDDGGESGLRYTWSSTGTPPSTPTYAPAPGNAAKNTVATVSKLGSYTFVCRIADAGGRFVDSNSVSVSVVQGTTTITVSPQAGTVVMPVRVGPGLTHQFSAKANDQFGALMVTQPTFSWSVTGGGAISTTTGLFTAGPTAGGPFEVRADVGAVRGTAAVRVAPNAAPVITAGTLLVAPNPVTGVTASASVAATDDDGEPPLTYTWSCTAAAVTFTANAGNAAKSTIVSFPAAGSYTLGVIVRDAFGLSANATVAVTVTAAAKRIAIDPPSAVLYAGQTQAFSATVVDQFGAPITGAPAPVWSGANVTAAGVYTAPPTAGTATVTASGSGLSATARIEVATPTVVMMPPPGTYFGDLPVALEAPPGCTVSYTTATSGEPADPVPGTSATYTAPVNVTASTVIKAVAWYTDAGSVRRAGAVVRGAYTLSSAGGAVSATSAAPMIAGYAPDGAGGVQVSPAVIDVQTTTIDRTFAATAAGAVAEVAVLGDRVISIAAPLAAEGATPIAASVRDDGGRLHQIGTWSRTWKPTDLTSAHAALRVRQGDSLLLTATTPDGQPVTLSANDAVATSFASGSRLPWRFQQPGLVLLEAEGADGAALGSVSVYVVASPFRHEPIACELDFTRTVRLAGVTGLQHLVFAAGDARFSAAGANLTVATPNRTYEATDLSVTPTARGRRVVVARLDGPTGPVAGMLEVLEFQVDRAWQTRGIISVGPRGEPTTFLRLRPFVPDLRVRIAGAYRPDGASADATITPVELDAEAMTLVWDPLAKETIAWTAYPTRLDSLGTGWRASATVWQRVAGALVPASNVAEIPATIQQITLGITTPTAQPTAATYPVQLAVGLTPGSPEAWRSLLLTANAGGRAAAMPLVNGSGQPITAPTDTGSGLSLIYRIATRDVVSGREVSPQIVTATRSWTPPQPPTLTHIPIGEKWVPTGDHLVKSATVNGTTHEFWSDGTPRVITLAFDQATLSATATVSETGWPIEKRMIVYEVSDGTTTWIEDGPDPQFLTRLAADAVPLGGGPVTYAAPGVYPRGSAGLTGVPPPSGTFSPLFIAVIGQDVAFGPATPPNPPGPRSLTETRDTPYFSIATWSSTASTFQVTLNTGAMDLMVLDTAGNGTAVPTGTTLTTNAGTAQNYGGVATGIYGQRRDYAVGTRGKDGILVVTAPAAMRRAVRIPRMWPGLGLPRGTDAAVEVVPGRAWVDLARGNLHVSLPYATYATPAAGPDCVISYNSQDVLETNLGVGWRTTYDMGIHRVGGTVMLVDETGRRTSFASVGAGTPGTVRYAANEHHLGAYLEMRTDATYPAGSGWNAGECWRLVRFDNRWCFFNARGALTRIRTLRGDTLTVTLDGNDRPTRVVDNSGRQLDLSASTIGTVTSRQLRQTANPESGVWTFAYDTRHNLTSLASGNATWTVAYADEAQGRDRIQSVTLKDPTIAGVATTFQALSTAAGTVMVKDVQGGTRTYTLAGATKTFTDVGLISRTVFDFKGSGALKQVVDAAGVTSAWTYGSIALTNPTRTLELARYGLPETATVGTRTETRRYNDRGSVVWQRSASSRDASAHLVERTMGPLTAATSTQLQWPDEAELPLASTTRGVAGVEGETGPVDLVTTWRWRTQAPGLGQLAAITDPCGGVTTHAYDDRNRLISVTDARGNRTRYAVDAYGQATTVTTPAGRTARASRDERGFLVSETDAFGIATTYTMDASRRVAQAKGPGPIVVTYTYDAFGRATVVERDGGDGKPKAIQRRSYDGLGRTLSEQQPGLNAVTTAWTRAGDGTWSATIRGGKSRTVVAYDAAGRVKSEAVDRVLAKGSAAIACTTVNTYSTADGWLDKTTDPLSQETTFSRDGFGRVVSTRNHAGGVSIARYNAVGWMLESSDADNRTTLATYDRCGRQVTGVNPAGGVTQTVTDLAGNVVAERSAGSARGETFTYDGDGVQTGRKDVFLQTHGLEIATATRTITSTGPLGLRSSRVLDALGRVQQEKILATGITELTSTLAYVDRADAPDNSGSVKRSDPGREPARSIADVAGRPVLSIVKGTVGGAVRELESSVAYDPDLGVPSQISDAFGHRSVTTFTSAGEAAKAEDNHNADAADTLAVGGEVLTRDKLGRTLTWTDAGGLRHEHVYDVLGRVQQRVAPNGARTVLTYSASGGGSLLTRVDTTAGGITRSTSFTHDRLGNVVTTQVAGAGEASRRVHDPMGRMLLESDGATSTAYRYDALTGALASVIKPGGRTVTMGRDALGRVTSVTDADNRTVGYGYDSLGRVTSATFPDGRSETRVYSSTTGDLQQLTERGTATGSATAVSRSRTFTRDGLGRVSEVAFDDGTKVRHDVAIWSDTGPRGLIESSTLVTRDTAGAEVLKKTTRHRDRGGQLRTLTLPDQTAVPFTYHNDGRPRQRAGAAFTYDANGQLIGISDAGGTATIVPNAFGQVQRVDLFEAGAPTTAVLSRVFGYDPAGRVASLVQTVAPHEVDTSDATYDTLGRLTSIRERRQASDTFGSVTQGETLTQFSYDHLGQLVVERMKGVPFRAIRQWSYDRRGNRTAQRTAGAIQDATRLDVPLAPGAAPVAWGTGTNAVLRLATRVTTAPTTTGAPDCRLEAAVTLGADEYPTQLGRYAVVVVAENVGGAASRWLQLEWRPTTGATQILAYSDRADTDTVGELTISIQPGPGIHAEITSSTGTSLRLDAPLVYLPHDHLGFAVGGTSATGATFATIAAETAADGAITTTRYGYSVADQLSSTETRVGATVTATESYVIDAFGRLERKARTASGSTATTTYGYDRLDRLVSLAGATTATYGYHGDSWMRASAVEAGVTTTFQWDGRNLLSSSSGGATTTYAYVGGRVAWTASGGTSFVGSDLLGNVTSRIARTSIGAPAGQTAWAPVSRQFYDAWGNARQFNLTGAHIVGAPVPGYDYAEGVIGKGPGYRGEWRDASGMTYLRHRYYEPGVGRFTQVDPAQAGDNWYAYCGGDPVNRIDPMGLDWEWIAAENGWRWKANEANGERADIIPPEWAVPGFDLNGQNRALHPDGIVSTADALGSRLRAQPGDPAVAALAQLVGSGVAGYNRWDDQVALRLYGFFTKHGISNGTAGVAAYNQDVDAQVRAIDAQVAEAAARGAQLDVAALKARAYSVAEFGVGMIPVVAVLEATVAGQQGEYGRAAGSAVAIAPWGRIFKAGGQLVAGAAEEVATGGRTVTKWRWGMGGIGDKDAQEAYAAIRSSTTDIDAIVRNQRLNARSAERLARIKEYLFNNPKFDADPEIAAAWHRLRTGAGTEADMILLKHEAVEMYAQTKHGLTQAQAHARATELFDWASTINGK